MKRLFWTSTLLLLYAQAGYGALLTALARAWGAPPTDARAGASDRPGEPPSVAVIVAAYAEERVIRGRIENLLSLGYPRERLQIVVACDGSPDRTAELARAAGADLVLELPRGGKIRAQDAAVAATDSEIVAFSDANALWAADALTELVAPFRTDPGVGYVCGQVTFVNERGDNQEGVYWRYEMRLRALESQLRSVTGGNGAIYATRREAYLVVDPVMGHDLSFPFNVVKRGRRALYAPLAGASEPMVPTVDGEFTRKRRMMSHTWAIVLRGGLLSPRGYDPLYALMIFSHRLLRYSTPFLHLASLGGALGLVRRSVFARIVLAGHAALLAGAVAGARRPSRPLALCRYYVLTTASPAAGLWDHLRHGTRAGWEPAPGTR